MPRRSERRESAGGPRLALRHKLALSGVVFGSFLIAGGFLQGYTDQLGSWGYLGGFIISFISSATIVLPAPGAVVIFLMAADFNPLILGVVTGVAGGLGATSAYFVGAASRDAVRSQRLRHWLNRVFRSRWGPALIVTCSAIPFFPGDIISAMAGAARYPLPPYLFYVITATTVKMIGITLAGAYATGWALQTLQRFL